MWRVWYPLYWLPKEAHWIMQWLGFKLVPIRYMTVYHIIGLRWMTMQQYYERAGQTYEGRGQFPLFQKKYTREVVRNLPEGVRERLGCYCHHQDPYGWVIAADCRWHD